MLRAVAIAVESFESPLSTSMQDCLDAIDSIRGEAVGVVAKISAYLPSFPDYSNQNANGEGDEREHKPHIRLVPALKAVLINGKRLQELRAQIRGISTSLSATLNAANAIQINEIRRYNRGAVVSPFNLLSLRNSAMATHYVIQNCSCSGHDQINLDGDPLYTTSDYTLRQIDLEESESSTRRSSIDGSNALTEIRPDREHNRKHQNLISTWSNEIDLSAGLASEPCRLFCPCQCHKAMLMRSPLWFNAIFGSVTFSSNTTVSLNRRHCNMPRICNRRGRLSAQFVYFTPFWVIAKAFSILATRSDVTGINTDLAFRAPRIIPMQSKIFTYILNGSVENIRDMIFKGEASIYDVDMLLGRSLLCAS
jgi:hypothetical protein